VPLKKYHCGSHRCVNLFTEKGLDMSLPSPADKLSSFQHLGGWA
jgi:hypothetical protein